MSSGETQAHRTLKRLALAWARTAGLVIAGVEVRIPHSGYRADVAAASRHPTGPEGRIALFECKQCRADLLRDQADEPMTRAQATALGARVDALRIAVASHRPDLRRGETLFPEFDAYDLAGLRHDTLHRLERELETMQQKLLTSVKFSRLHAYHAADLLYLVTEPGILEAHEVPNGWGWLVRDGECLVLATPPVRLETQPARRLAWLESIAIAGTRAEERASGLRRRPAAQVVAPQARPEIGASEAPTQGGQTAT